MAISFPASPSQNDTYTYEGLTYTFVDGRWSANVALFLRTPLVSVVLVLLIIKVPLLKVVLTLWEPKPVNLIP